VSKESAEESATDTSDQGPRHPLPFGQTDRCCDRDPCFQARLLAVKGVQRVGRTIDLCADHLGDTVTALAAWARAEGLEGEITVIAIGLPESSQAPRLSGRPGLPFSTIPISPHE
jgi:hypothetical protein